MPGFKTASIKEIDMSSIVSVMKVDVVTVEKGTPIIEAVGKLVKHNFTGLPVVDRENRVVGILSEKDVLALAISMYENPEGAGNEELKVEDFMTKDVVCADASESFAALCNCLMKNQFRRVPIVANGKLVGIVSRKDIIAEIMSLHA